VYQLPLSTLIGQPAFSNSTFRQTDLRSALHRLQATKSKLRHKLKPHHKAGQEVAKLLQVRNAALLLQHADCGLAFWLLICLSCPLQQLIASTNTKATCIDSQAGR